MDESEVQVPSYFICPISLLIMRDPVTLPTGITYDRDSIERWLYSGNPATCPVTKQPIPDCDLTPNHTLRRLIQSWCAANTSLGVERFPTPRPPVDKAQISSLLDEARLPHSRLPALTKLKKIASESERNKRCVEAVSGAIDILASFISSASFSENESAIASDEAVSILNILQLSDQGLRGLLEQNPDIFESLTTILRRSDSYQTRAHTVLLIKALVGVACAGRLISVRKEFFEEIVKVLGDRISYQAMKAAMQVLYAVCPWGRNTEKAVRAGAVNVLIELLLDEPEKRASEMMMMVLDELCAGSASGRAEVVGHAAGLAVVSKKMLRVSPVATERAVKVVYSISSNRATPAVLEEMLHLGVVSKLCMLLQVECGKSTRKMAKEILRMHLNVWRRSPCLNPQLKALYPSSS